MARRINNNILTIMEEKKITKEEIAKFLSITVEDVNRLISGEITLNVLQLMMFKSVAKVEVEEIYPFLGSHTAQIDSVLSMKLEEDNENESEKIGQREVNNINRNVNSSNVSTYYGHIHHHNVGLGATIVGFFTGWGDFTIDVIHKKMILLFAFLVGALVIITDNHLNLIFDIFPKNLFMLFAYRWTIIAILIGLMLPLLIKSWFAYILLYNGIANAIYIIEQMVLGTYGVSNASTWFRVMITVVALVLTFIYGFWVRKMRAKLLLNSNKQNKA